MYPYTSDKFVCYRYDEWAPWSPNHKQFELQRASNAECVFMPLQYIPRNMHTVFALLCFVVVIHWLIFPYPSGLLHWHCGNLTIAPVPAKQPWWIWINTSCEFIMNDCITTTKQSTTKPCAYFLGYTVRHHENNPCHQFSYNGGMSDSFLLADAPSVLERATLKLWVDIKSRHEIYLET